MIKTEFKRVAEKVNGKFYFKDETLDIGGGVRSPDVTFLIKFVHKGVEVAAMNQTGTSFVGTVLCSYPERPKKFKFEIDNRSYLSRLFFRKKPPFIIKTQNKNLDYFFRHNKALKALSDIAKKVQFEPFFSGKNVKGKYKVITKYHLEFDDWTQVLEPLVQFYIDLIDEFEKYD